MKDETILEESMSYNLSISIANDNKTIITCSNFNQIRKWIF